MTRRELFRALRGGTAALGAVVAASAAVAQDKPCKWEPTARQREAWPERYVAFENGVHRVPAGVGFTISERCLVWDPKGKFARL